MNKSVINEIREKLFILLGFTLPLSIAVTNILIVVIALICIIEGGFPEKWNKIKSSKWMISLLFLLILYFLYYLILGTFTDTFWILKRVSLLLILPILYSTTFSLKTIKTSTFYFLVSMFLSSVIAIAENLEIISLNQNWRWSAFLIYTDHNTFLAAALLLSIYCISKLKLEKTYKIIIQIFIPFYLFSLFTEGGRSGQIVFIILLSLFLIYFFRSKIKFLLLSFVGLFLFSYLTYNNSEIVQKRIDHTIQFYKNLESKEKSSTNTRYVLVTETLKIIKQNPIL